MSKTKVIRFRCTQEQFDKIKALAGPDVSAWILAKLLPIEFGGVEVVATRMSSPVVTPSERPVIDRIVKPTGQKVFIQADLEPCIHCSKPGVSKGWHNSVLVWFCKDHS